MAFRILWLAAAPAALALVLAGCGGSDGGAGGKKPASGEKGAPMPAPEGGKTAAKAQTTCPIMDGNKIDKSIYTDYQGKRVYFCCRACPPVFAKDPEKYIKQMEAAGIVLEAAPAPAPAPAAAP